MTPRYPRLCAAALLVFCTVLLLAPPFTPKVEAKGKKGKRAVSHRRTAHQSRRSRLEASRNLAAESDYAIVPDEVEVLEYGASTPSQLSRWLSPPAPRNPVPASYSEPDLTTPAKLRSVKIDSTRALQIQQALAARGFYRGEMTGLYDEATVDGMRRFQAANKISVTGYPTAAALKRLGLTSW